MNRVSSKRAAGRERAAQDALRGQLVAAGFRIIEEVPGTVCGSDGTLRVRASPTPDGGLIELAVEAHFDRWANSVDFLFKLPPTDRGLAERLALARRKVAAGQYDAGLSRREWL